MADRFDPCLSLDLIVPSPTNPRKRFDLAGIVEMAQSMKGEAGVLEALIVRPKGDVFGGSTLSSSVRALCPVCERHASLTRGGVCRQCSDTPYDPVKEGVTVVDRNNLHLLDPATARKLVARGSVR